MLSKNTFANPESKYRPIPFWFWNSRLDKSEIEAQIRDFHEKGLGGFFIHARFGLETDYLSDEWMDCVRQAVQTAEELGLEVWLYDENAFPSGIGDLKVSRVPEYRSHFVDLTEARISGPESVELKLPHGEIVAAHAHRADQPVGESIDLAECVIDGVLRWTAPEGEWQASVYSRCFLEDPNDVVFGVDYLNPRAMREFFDITLKPYQNALGEHFGKTIKGIFTDEPTLLPWHHNLCWLGEREHGRVVVWDDGIEREMKSRFGLNAGEFLPHLFYDIDDSSPDVRRGFWRVVSDLYVSAFFEPYREWCDQHGMKLTGHVLFEEGLYINTDFQADITEVLCRMHIPGTDHLCEITETPYGGYAHLPHQLTNLQGEKLVASIGHVTGAEAVISETYGCCGWGLTLQKMKWIADWQYSLGVNMLCPHAVFYSIEGFRKSDAPPSENHMPGWKHYRTFADYIGRLSYMLRQGRHVAKIALLYPLSEFWGAHKIGSEGKRDREISDTFDLCASTLAALHFDYDIVSEQALAQAETHGARLRIGRESYEVLIAEPSALTGETAERAQEFVSSGGKHLVPPRPADLQDRVQFADELERSLLELIVPDVMVSRLDGQVRRGQTPDIRAPEIRYVHREAGSQHIFFFANTSDKSLSAALSLEVQGSVEQWNPETGAVGPAEAEEAPDGRLVVKHDFMPYGSTILVVDSEKPFPPQRSVPSRRDTVLTLPDTWQFHTEQPNALILDAWTFSPQGCGSEAYTYSAKFRCAHVPKDMMLMLDDVEYRSSLMGGMDLLIEVNDKSWHNPQFGWYIDKGFKTLQISDALRRGENNIRITIRHSAWSGQPHLINSPPILLGTFACDPKKKAVLRPVEQVSSGSWTDYGYPCFSGTAVYSTSFRLPAAIKGEKLIVALEAVSDMAEVVVNGQTAKALLWQPWEAEITDLVREGNNTLAIKVTNSMLNLLEGNARESGLMGAVRILVER